jgi:hypothetical protein
LTLPSPSTYNILSFCHSFIPFVGVGGRWEGGRKVRGREEGGRKMGGKRRARGGGREEEGATTIAFSLLFNLRPEE